MNILSFSSCYSLPNALFSSSEIHITKSTDARQHALERHVQPVRGKNGALIQMKVGDINKELGWPPRCRQIIAALWSDEFEETARVKNIEKPGPKPPESSTVVLRFRVLG